MANIHKLEKENLEELYRVHFPGSPRHEVTMEEQGHPNLGAFVANREGWELSGRGHQSIQNTMGDKYIQTTQVSRGS
jgi:hypothetical protein